MGMEGKHSLVDRIVVCILFYQWPCVVGRATFLRMCSRLCNHYLFVSIEKGWAYLFALAWVDCLNSGQVSLLGAWHFKKKLSIYLVYSQEKHFVTPTMIHVFRPISLSNVLHKLIFKTICNMFKLVLPHVQTQQIVKLYKMIYMHSWNIK